jgi:hypothetical protein
MNKIESAIISTAVTYITNYVNNEKKNYVIEPLTCMIRLAMLAYKPRGTKICIYDNSIYIQEPGLLQGTLRWISGNNRNDIHYLLSPINKAIKRYKNKDNSEAIQNIFKLAIKGLMILRTSYTRHSIGNLTTHSLELYINKIKMFLEGNDVNHSDDELDDDENTYNSLKCLWTDEQLEIINDLFIQCDKNNKDSDSYLQAIEEILNSKLKLTKEILIKNINNCI